MNVFPTNIIVGKEYFAKFNLLVGNTRYFKRLVFSVDNAITVYYLDYIFTKL